MGLGCRRQADRLPGARAKGEGDVVPSIEVWGRPRQMQDEAADRAADVNAEFEQPVAQPRHLGAGAGGACGAQAEFLHGHVGGGRQEDAQLVRPELAAARTVDLQTVRISADREHRFRRKVNADFGGS